MKKLISLICFGLLFATTQVAQLPVNLVDGTLIGYWPLDTAVDIDDTLPGQVFTTPDMSPYENDGTFLSPYNFPDIPNMPQGRFDNCLSLNGINNQGRVRLDGILDGVTVTGPDSIRTISLWMKVGSDQFSHILMSDSGGINVDPITIPVNTWTNVIAFVRPMGIGSNFAVYVNGSLQSWYTNSSDNLIIGGPSFVGLIDDVAIWNRALTATEVFDIQSQSPTSVMSFDNLTPNFSVYPNPTTDVCRVTWGSDSSVSRVVVYDNIGKISFDSSVQTDTYKDIYFGDLPVGVYVLMVVNDNQPTWTTRIVKN